jgi:long-chain acyl-CoA synthetase
MLWGAAMDFDVRTAIAGILDSGGTDPVIRFDGRWRDRAWIEAFRGSIRTVVDVAVLKPGSAVALVARNRPAHLAVIAAQAADGRLTSMIYAAQTPRKIASDIESVSAPIVLADPEDWTEETLAATTASGALAVAIHDGDLPRIEPLTLPCPVDLSRFSLRDPAIGFEMLSSGTTGPPKRVPLSWATLSSATADARTSYAGSGTASAPQIMIHPIGNIAGVSYLLPIFAFGQRVVLMEKFDVREWIEIVRTHRPVRASLPAAGVRMVLDANPPREALASLSIIAVGGGKLDDDLQRAFEVRFGIPVLPAFGATEFAGVIANWSLDAYREYGESKRGSAGRASANVELRIVDRETRAPLSAGQIGLLEAKVARIGSDWIGTTDLASLDVDGFLFIHGRADGAINRGGFKIVPEQIAMLLRQHPAIADAIVVARPDQRLGEVPVAAVELRSGMTTTPAELSIYLRDLVTAYQMPVEIRVLAILPRNGSMKIAITEVREEMAR